MTISEPIKALSQFDSDTSVVIQGYESGFNDVSIIELLTMQVKFNPVCINRTLLSIGNSICPIVLFST
jgi:hypothetical protein